MDTTWHSGCWEVNSVEDMAVTIGNPTMGEDHVAAQEPYGKDSALVCVCVFPASWLKLNGLVQGLCRNGYDPTVQVPSGDASSSVRILPPDPRLLDRQSGPSFSSPPAPLEFSGHGAGRQSFLTARTVSVV